MKVVSNHSFGKQLSNVRFSFSKNTFIEGISTSFILSISLLFQKHPSRCFDKETKIQSNKSILKFWKVVHRILKWQNGEIDDNLVHLHLFSYTILYRLKLNYFIKIFYHDIEVRYFYIYVSLFHVNNEQQINVKCCKN